MTYFPDLSPYSYAGSSNCGGYEVLNIGWLDGTHEFSTSEIDNNWLDQIRVALSEDRLIKLSRGEHLCELCGNEAGDGEFHAYNPRTNRVYAAPGLLLHYVEVHHYAPPEEFIEAVGYKILEENYCQELQSAAEMRQWGLGEQQSQEIIHNILGDQTA